MAEHVCGLTGFGALGDTCPACEERYKRWDAQRVAINRVKHQLSGVLGALPIDWHQAALRLGEELASVGPTDYCRMTPQEWLDWALAQIRRLQEFEFMYKGLTK